MYGQDYGNDWGTFRVSFPTYENTNESGISWVGKIPIHWEVKPFFGMVHERKLKNKGMINNNLLSLSYGKIIQKDIETMDGLLPASFETYQLVKTGDIIFRLTDLQNDKRSLRSALVEEDGIITSAYLAVVPVNQNSRFLNYLYRAYDVTKVFYSMGGGLRQSMRYSDLKWMPTILPPLEEQKAISSFLDAETAKIDALVSEQRRLIELLKEKRQAVISHAVTKGLNPNAPMKPSGIEWLGDVPEHWDIKPLKSVVIHQSSNVDKKSVEGQAQVKLCNYTDVYYHDLIVAQMDFMKATATDEQIEKFTLRADDVIITKDSESSDDIAVSTYIPEDLTGVVCGYHLAMLRPISDTNGLFIKRLFDSAYIKALVAVRANGLTRVGLGQLALKTMPLPIPPPCEQAEIVKCLEDRLETFSQLQAEAERAIELLQKRRTALISAAVTGKIDVRNYNNTSEQY